MSLSILVFTAPDKDKIFHSTYFMFKDKDFLELLVNIFLIFSFGSLIKKSGHLKRLGERLLLVFPDRIAITILPMIMGFFPMPGGALFTVDFVRQVGEDKSFSKDILSFANYWFRHVWEFIYPLYPGFILYYTLLRINPLDIVKRQAVLSLIMILSGYFIIFRNSQKKDYCIKKASGNIISLIRDLWFIAIIFIFIFLSLPVYIALFLCCAIVALSHKMKIYDVLSTIKGSINIEVLFTIYFVFFFQKVLEISELSLEMQSFIGDHPESSLLICVVFPFLTGYLTGITTSYVGICFPVLLPLFEGNIWLAVVSYTSGFAGVLLTPVHLCLSLTVSSFKANFKKVYLFIIPISILLIFSSLILYVL
jgi:integral membrane protein (TIGR00529 family)